MTERQMHKLADIIIAKLEIKQQEWDNDFHENIAQHYTNGATSPENFITLTEEQMLIAELARLQTILMIFENNEEYEKAAVVLSNLNRVKSKLRKGDYNDD